MSTADLKGVHAVQNLGAVQTYLRRYLYMAMLNITESDELDRTLDPDRKACSENPEKRAEPKPTLPSMPTTRPQVTDPQAKVTTDMRDYLVGLTFINGIQDVVRLAELKRLNANKGYSRTSDCLQKDFSEIADAMEEMQHE